MLLQIENAADGIQACWRCDSAVNFLPPSAPWARDLNWSLVYVLIPPPTPFSTTPNIQLVRSSALSVVLAW